MKPSKDTEMLEKQHPDQNKLVMPNGLQRFSAGCLFLYVATCSDIAQAGNFNTELSPSRNQISRYFNGQQILISPKQETSVSVKVINHERKNEISFYIIAANLGQLPFDFGTSNIKILGNQDSGTLNKDVIEILSFSDIEARDRRKAKTERFFAGMAAAGRSLQVADASTVRTSGSFTANSQSTIGGQPNSTNTVGSISVSTIDPLRGALAQDIVNKQNKEEQTELQIKQRNRTKSLDSYLKTQTIDPKQFHGGYFVVKLKNFSISSPNERSMTMTVQAGNETHEIILKIRETP
jgi:hypothetical protein